MLQGLLEDILTGFWEILVEDNGGTAGKNRSCSALEFSENSKNSKVFRDVFYI